jgi:hypothetical protein
MFCCPDCGMVSHNPADAEHGYCGNCHAFTGNPGGGALRFRLYVDRRIAAEAWVTLDAGFEQRAAQVGDEQNALARKADEAGLLWHVEVYDPALPPDRAYARLGTDKGAMIIPVPIEPRQERTQ